MFRSPLLSFSWLTGSTGVGSGIREKLVSEGRRKFITEWRFVITSLVEPPSGPDSFASRSRLVEGCRRLMIFRSWSSTFSSWPRGGGRGGERKQLQ